MLIRSTKEIDTSTLNVLVYGQAGVGKTRLCATVEGPALILSAEAGLLTLREHDIDAITIESMADLVAAYGYLQGNGDGGKYKWVCIDSITEVAEVVLAAEKKVNKDPRQAYGALIDKTTAMVRAFRDLPGRNVYMSAKTERTNDAITGALVYAAAMPGAKLGQQLPHFFDVVCAMRADKNEEGETVRWLQTAPCIQYSAKDRSGVLDPQERPDLGAIERKILTTKTGD